MEGALSSIRNRAEGQGLAEYALILSLIALIAIAALGIIGGDLNTMLSDVGVSI
jgi:Flp pilus assembly pilin Flp